MSTEPTPYEKREQEWLKKMREAQEAMKRRVQELEKQREAQRDKAIKSQGQTPENPLDKAKKEWEKTKGTDDPLKKLSEEQQKLSDQAKKEIADALAKLEKEYQENTKNRTVTDEYKAKYEAEKAALEKRMADEKARQEAYAKSVRGGGGGGGGETEQQRRDREAREARDAQQKREKEERDKRDKERKDKEQKDWKDWADKNKPRDNKQGAPPELSFTAPDFASIDLTANDPGPELTPPGYRERQKCIELRELANENIHLRNNNAGSIKPDLVKALESTAQFETAKSTGMKAWENYMSTLWEAHDLWMNNCVVQPSKCDSVKAKLLELNQIASSYIGKALAQVTIVNSVMKDLKTYKDRIDPIYASFLAAGKDAIEYKDAYKKEGCQLPAEVKKDVSGQSGQSGESGESGQKGPTGATGGTGPTETSETSGSSQASGASGSST